jgi:hypothetical protein
MENGKWKMESMFEPINIFNIFFFPFSILHLLRHGLIGCDFDEEFLQRGVFQADFT